MNKAVLEKDVQLYINAHLHDDPLVLLLKKATFPNISQKELVDQIESKKKSQKKLPTWFQTENIYYPHKLNLSQTSSETTAQYKASLVQGDTLADLTGGFGVDSFVFSKNFRTVFHLERDSSLSAIAKHNFKALAANNIETIASEGVKWLRHYPKKLDCIYIDPSRRDDSNKKVFLLADCQPDITQIMDLLMQKTNTLMVKTGPLLDIDAGLNQLYAVAEIHIVAVENEVKELLWIIKKDFKGNISVCTRNFQKSEVQEFDFELQDKSMANAVYSLPLTFLYEPNVAIMKSGAFNLVATTFGLKKLHANTHLYTSEQQIHFPGRVFRIINVLPYKKNAWQTLGLKKAHITTRNFKYSVAQLRKQTRLQDGGHDYLFFTTETHGEPLIIHTRKVKITRVKNNPRKAD